MYAFFKVFWPVNYICKVDTKPNKQLRIQNVQSILLYYTIIALTIKCEIQNDFLI